MARDVRSGRKGRSGGDRSKGKPDAPTSKGGGKRDADPDESKRSRRDRAADRRRAVKPGAKGKSQAGAQKERRGGFIRFVGECAGELRKVDWPGQRQLMAATIAVLVAVAVVGVFLFAADEALSRLVRDVLLAG
ncbi:MAG: preprotein translocase subunit SecE [Gaiellaceae bacterium]